MNRIARRAGVLLLLALLLIGGIVLFVVEFSAKAGSWVVFPGSPHVYNGGNIGCGTVVDREGVILLELNDQRAYSKSDALRKSTVHWLGDRSGSVDAQALASHSHELVGFDLLNGIYSYGESGSVATLTLSAQAQMAALEALGNYRGTVAVYNYKTGQILCAVTTPAFDPDNAPVFDEENPPEEYKDLYWNKFTQFHYVPGSIFKVVTLAAVVEAKPEILEKTFTCKGSYVLEPDKITCEIPHGEQNVKTAFKNSCNCAFAQIVLELGGDTLQECVEQFQVTESVNFDGITTAKGNFLSTDVAQVSAAWAGIGQYNDEINPCAFLTFMGSIANGGQGVEPYIVKEISGTYHAKTQKRDRIMSEDTAKLLTEYLRNNVENKYGDGNFPGMTVCAKTGTAEVGGGKKPNAMLAGFVTDEATPWAFIVCVEDAGYGGQVCLPIASKVLAACKEHVG
ncbi:MAG: penicillin-binding protein [Oscillospiraceae bacterium]|nr:penicillin-binding protein [Oscillospiraceae bacterium]